MMANIESFFWAMMWVVILLIVAMAVLHFISNFGGGIGNIADWIGKKTEY